MMRCTEGSSCHQLLAPDIPTHFVNLRHLDLLVAIERWQQSRQSAGQKTLSRTGRAHHQKRVLAGGGNLQHPSRLRMPPHIGKILKWLNGIDRFAGIRRRWIGAGTAKYLERLLQGRDSHHFDPFHGTRQRVIGDRNHHRSCRGAT